jgi:hypothetical protein
MHKQIQYNKIMELGFKEEFHPDSVYFNQNGFDYSIISKDLTKRISLDWEKDTKLCWLYRTDKHTIVKRVPVVDLEHLEDIIDFFCVDDDDPFKKIEEDNDIENHFSKHC